MLTNYDSVTFDSHGDTIVGRLYAAAFGSGPAPGVAILGPMTYQKEQAPSQYAERLSRLGFATLVFDPRYRGESGGLPRCYENPAAKVEDLNAALDYLAGRDDVDASRLAVVGICMGAGHVLTVAADNPLVGAVASISGHYRDPAADQAWMGSADAVRERLARGVAARAAYERTGQVEYVPAVDARRADVGMPGELVWSWYQLAADRGEWENQYAVLSDEAVFRFETLSAAARMRTPLLMMHGDRCAVPDAARRHFAVVPTPDKQLIWDNQTRHLQFYDDPAVIDRAVWEIADWFAIHLSTRLWPEAGMPSTASRDMVARRPAQPTVSRR